MAHFHRILMSKKHQKHTFELPRTKKLSFFVATLTSFPGCSRAEQDSAKSTKIYSNKSRHHVGCFRRRPLRQHSMNIKLRCFFMIPFWEFRASCLAICPRSAKSPHGISNKNSRSMPKQGGRKIWKKTVTLELELHVILMGGVHPHPKAGQRRHFRITSSQASWALIIKPAQYMLITTRMPNMLHHQEEQRKMTEKMQTRWHLQSLLISPRNSGTQGIWARKQINKWVISSVSCRRELQNKSTSQARRLIKFQQRFNRTSTPADSPGNGLRCTLLLWWMDSQRANVQRWSVFNASLKYTRTYAYACTHVHSWGPKLSQGPSWLQPSKKWN